jgi:hypothetical protein
MCAACVSCLAASSLAAEEPRRIPDLKALEYSIELNAKEYMEGQDVIVTSTIKNISDKPVETLEPWAMAWTVTFDVQKEEDGKRVSVLKPCGIPNGQGYWSRQIILKPGESQNQSCEIGYQLDGKLPSGKYVLEAKYHPIKDGEDGYFAHVLAAKRVPFRVVPVEGDELAWPELREHLAELIDGDEPSRRQAENMIRAFIKDHPKSVFLPQAYDSLLALQSRNGDDEGFLRDLAELRKTNISENERQRLIAVECVELAELGRYEEAIRLAKTGTSNECEGIPDYVEVHKQLRAQKGEKKKHQP